MKNQRLRLLLGFTFFVIAIVTMSLGIVALETMPEVSLILGFMSGGATAGVFVIIEAE